MVSCSRRPVAAPEHHVLLKLEPRLSALASQPGFWPDRTPSGAWRAPVECPVGLRQSSASLSGVDQQTHWKERTALLRAVGCQASHTPFHPLQPCGTESPRCIDEDAESQGGEATAQLSLQTGVTNAGPQERLALRPRRCELPSPAKCGLLTSEATLSAFSAHPLSDGGRV